MRVVIVNGDEPLLLAMREWIVGAGHEVVTFGRFEPAKTYLATAHTDALVTDVRLGAFNGLQLVMIAKHGHPETTAVVLSNAEDPVLRNDAANIGACFCVKPIDSEQLLHGIHGAASEPMDR
jgi:two-component system cell cycle response regulator